MIAPRPSTLRSGGKHVDGAVLSGTLAPDFSGTRIPYYRERGRLAGIGFNNRNLPPLTFLTEESLGFLLTRSAETPDCGRAAAAAVRGARNRCRLPVLPFTEGARP